MERRKHPRVLYRCAVTLWRGPAPVRINCYTKNVSQEGVCLVLDEELPIHQEARVQLDLDDGLPALVCQARVVWTLAYRAADYPVDSPTRYQTGFHFTDISETDQSRVHRVISQRVPD